MILEVADEAQCGGGIHRRPYRKTYAQYALEIWPAKDPESSERTIKRWVQEGRRADPVDLPPLDELPLMAAWYERTHKWRAPEGLVKFAQRVAHPPPLAADGDDYSDDDALPPMVLGDAVQASDLGLQQAQALVKATYDQMHVALAGNRMTQYNALVREWKGLVQILRQWEKDIVQIQEGRGDVLRTRVINSELVRLFNAMAQSFFNALLKVIQEFATDLPPADQRKKALELRDQVFGHLKGNRFEKVWKP